MACADCSWTTENSKFNRPAFLTGHKMRRCSDLPFALEASRHLLTSRALSARQASAVSGITNNIPAHEYTSVDEGFRKWREEAALEWRLSTESRALHSSAGSPALLKVVFSHSLNPPASFACVWHSLSPLPHSLSPRPSPVAPRPSLPSLRMQESCGPFVEADSGLGETSSGAAWAASARGGSSRPTAGGARKHPRSAAPPAHTVLAFFFPCKPLAAEGSKKRRNSGHCAWPRPRPRSSLLLSSACLIPRRQRAPALVSIQ